MTLVVKDKSAAYLGKCQREFFMGHTRRLAKRV